MAILTIYASVTARYVPVFHDEFTLWSHVVQVDPQRPRARINLGAQYWIKGDVSSAIEQFQHILADTETRFDDQSQLARSMAGGNLANLGVGIPAEGQIQAPWCLSVEGTSLDSHSAAKLRLLVMPPTIPRPGSSPCPAR